MLLTPRFLVSKFLFLLRPRIPVPLKSRLYLFLSIGDEGEFKSCFLSSWALNYVTWPLRSSWSLSFCYSLTTCFFSNFWPLPSSPDVWLSWLLPRSVCSDKIYSSSQKLVVWPTSLAYPGFTYVGAVDTSSQKCFLPFCIRKLFQPPSGAKWTWGDAS